MLEVVLSNRFKKDLKLAARRGCNFELLNEIVNKLARITLYQEIIAASENAILRPTGCLSIGPRTKT